MSLQDPISDALTMIRNASRAKKEKVDVKFSKLIEEILKILKKRAYISNYKKIEDKIQGSLRVYLKYNPKGDAVITELRRISKPGLRIYVAKDEIPKVLGGFGMAVLTTSKGIMTDEEARKNSVGGEILLYAW